MSAIEKLVFIAGACGMICLGFGILGIVSDLIFPHCKWLNDWIGTLPMMQEEKIPIDFNICLWYYKSTTQK